MVKLRAIDLEDLGILSGMVQDALAPVRDILYLRDDQQFVLALNRFMWETAGDEPPFQRSHAGLRFDHVTDVARRNLPRSDGGRGARDKMLSLLSINWHAPHVVLTFSGEAAIRLTVDKLSVGLQDLGEPWPTQWKPAHTPE